MMRDLGYQSWQLSQSMITEYKESQNPSLRDHIDITGFFLSMMLC